MDTTKHRDRDLIGITAMMAAALSQRSLYLDLRWCLADISLRTTERSADWNPRHGRRRYGLPISPTRRGLNGLRRSEKMAQTIETPSGTLVSVQVIWDRDHERREEGWFLRSRYADSTLEDERVDALDSLPCDTDDARLCQIAVEYLMPPDGLTSADLTVLQRMIEVRR